jgi:hypothetical protein
MLCIHRWFHQQIVPGRASKYPCIGSDLGRRLEPGDYPALFLPPIVAMEEVMPRAIKSPETAEYVVAVVLTMAICLTLIVAAYELPTKFIFP